MIRGLRVPVHLTSREALRMFDVADIWAARTHEEVRLVSGNDHVHARRSAHYRGLAVDFHSSDPDGLSAAFRRLGYHVLWRVRGHFDHVHVEDAPDPSVLRALPRGRLALQGAALPRLATSLGR